jgi:hypothetical protein
MLKASLEREVAVGLVCGQCGGNRDARWRCRDCTLPDVLCRACMRGTHMNNPLHHIECWTGTHFRRAELKEVGVVVIIRHRATGMCETLQLERNLHEAIQIQMDAHDLTGTPPEVGEPAEEGTAAEGAGSESADPDDDAFEEYMNNIYREETEEDGDEDPHEYGVMLESGTCSVVHTNGLHRLHVVTCGCRGPEEAILDLVNCRMLPTSFSRLSTLFTTAVLDDFRLTNLECKASAYQYWQRLKRLTNPMEPDRVPDRYKELLRMSRLWRWMKKLKWAGFGQHPVRKATDAEAGELTIFCPACPQLGINIEADWIDDPIRWVPNLSLSHVLMCLFSDGSIVEYLWSTEISRPIISA